MKYCSIDIEIVNSIPDGEDWRDYTPLGISCAATFRTGDHAPIIWYPGYHQTDIPGEGAMSLEELISMMDYMTEQYRFGFLPLTFNGIGFDFPILAMESGDLDASTLLALNGIDMMFHFFCKQGYPVSLANSNAGMGLKGKTEGMSGELAPLLWRNEVEQLEKLGLYDLAELSPVEKRQYVLKYVGQDVIAAHDLAQAVDKNNGEMFWITKSGHKKGVRLGPWLQAYKALELKEKNFDWMDLKRENFTSWMDGAGD